MDRFGQLFSRLLFSVAGAGIIYHETFLVNDAQWEVLLVGLWLIGVPPALWLDSIRELVTARREPQSDEYAHRRSGDERESRHRHYRKRTRNESD